MINSKVRNNRKVIQMRTETTTKETDLLRENERSSKEGFFDPIEIDGIIRLAIPVESSKRLTQEEAQNLEENVANFVHASLDIMVSSRDSAVMQRMAEMLTAKKPATPTIIRQAVMQAAAKERILQSGQLLTATEVAKIAGLSEKNPSSQPNKWKRSGLIFAVHHLGVDYFPAYLLDPDNSYRPLADAKAIIETLSQKKGPWAMAFWFESSCGALGGETPKEMLSQDPQAVLAAAQKEAMGIIHG